MQTTYRNSGFFPFLGREDEHKLWSQSAGSNREVGYAKIAAAPDNFSQSLENPCPHRECGRRLVAMCHAMHVHGIGIGGPVRDAGAGGSCEVRHAVPFRRLFFVHSDGGGALLLMEWRWICRNSYGWRLEAPEYIPQDPEDIPAAQEYIPDPVEYILVLPEYIPVLPEYIPVLPAYSTLFPITSEFDNSLRPQCLQVHGSDAP